MRLTAPSRANQAAPPRSLRRRLSPQAIDELVARYIAGEQTPALSREYGISESGCRDLLRAEGVSLRGHAITVQDAEQAVNLYENGLTITQVVAQVGYSHGTIRKVLLEHGVAIRAGIPRKRNVKGELLEGPKVDRAETGDANSHTKNIVNEELNIAEQADV